METRVMSHLINSLALPDTLQDHGTRHATSVYASVETWRQSPSLVSCWSLFTRTRNTGLQCATRNTGSDCSEIRSWSLSQVCKASLIHGYPRGISYRPVSVSICVWICHKSEFYRNVWTDRAGEDSITSVRTFRKLWADDLAWCTIADVYMRWKYE